LLLSVCPSVAYIANNSRTQRPSVPKFGRKVPVPHLRCDSLTSFKVIGQRSRSRSQGPLTLTHIVRHIFQMAKPIRTSNLVYGWRTTTRISHRHHDLQGQRSLIRETKCCTRVIRGGRGHTMSAEPGCHTSCFCMYM